MPDWIWLVIIFAAGCCIGSFLNVVIYRLPRDRSVITPPSACPSCGNVIRWYDNIPLVSWVLLGRKCRYCKSPISCRYFVIELLSGMMFVGLFYLYFHSYLRAGVGSFFGGGGWLIYLLSIVLLSGLLAASAIDLELWIIPLCICWFITIAGLIGCSIAGLVIEPGIIRGYAILPVATARTGSLAVGGCIGLAISLVLLRTGLVKESYETDPAGTENPPDDDKQPEFNHRIEVCKEIVFLLPIIICSTGSFYILHKFVSVRGWWLDFSQGVVVSGLLGGIWGYFVGCGVVWATRILGTLAFGREAMGLGDVHLMGAAGTIIGPAFVVAAFFIAPFFGLGWAGIQMFFRKTRQIPYGPFLSLGVLVVMILHDEILNKLVLLFYH